MNESYSTTLDFYNVYDEESKQKIIAEQGMHTIAHDLRKINWESVAEKMRKMDE